ncbi:hypothetical protein [Flavobacterium sp. LM4]|uniref:hypothetical protein n=1 Tax=Flavobacterium sp. LM4 TaxID=1938609 RepID=UPI001CB8D6DB|nr:hypothetical protein [Flavobacterium sp. LM4]
MVDDKKNDLAIVTKKYETFDTLQVLIGNCKLVIVSSYDLDLGAFKKAIAANDMINAEKWLNNQKCYNHDAQMPHIKIFWLYAFDKKRPSVISNYIIPNEN